MKIFLDESGDLGFDFSKKKTSKKFVITVLVCNSLKAVNSIQKAVQRTLKNKINRKKKGKNIVHELKGTHTSLEVKKYFYKNLEEENLNVYSIILNKKRVDDHLKTKVGKKKLYNYLSHLLIKRLNLSKANRNVELIVDKCKNKEEIKDFNQYLCNQLEAHLPLNVFLNITHLSSHESTGLQAVDLFTWGIWRKYELRDRDWYEVYKEKIRYETEYLK